MKGDGRRTEVDASHSDAGRGRVSLGASCDARRVGVVIGAENNRRRQTDGQCVSLPFFQAPFPFQRRRRQGRRRTQQDGRQGLHFDGVKHLYALREKKQGSEGARG